MSPHPYGIRPHGNLYGGGSKNVLSTSLGRLRQLDDAGLLVVLGKLDARDLATCSAASVGLYAFCHADSLWRNLTLAECGGDFSWVGSWKETCIRSTAPSRKYAGHTPLVLRDVYSDVLYDPWMAVAIRMDPAWLMV